MVIQHVKVNPQDNGSNDVLNTAMPWHLHYHSVSSTMDTAAYFAGSQAPHMSLISAEDQVRARGRQGKAWSMLPGAFAGTYIARQGLGQHLPLVISLALLKACQQLNPTANLAIKWPNDLLRDGKKIAGILVEQRSDRYALIGIGLNLMPEKGAPYPALFDVNPATPLKACPALTTCIEQHLHLYSQHGWSAFSAEYSENCATIGQKISWKQNPTTEISGTVKGLNATGALMLEDENGVITLIHAGEVVAQAAMPE